MDSRVHLICPRCWDEHEERFAECPDAHVDYSLITINEHSAKPFDNDSANVMLRTPEKREVVDLLTCPINWQEIRPDSKLAAALEIYWRKIAEAYLDENYENLEWKHALLRISVGDPVAILIDPTPNRINLLNHKFTPINSNPD